MDYDDPVSLGNEWKHRSLDSAKDRNKSHNGLFNVTTTVTGDSHQLPDDWDLMMPQCGGHGTVVHGVCHCEFGYQLDPNDLLYCVEIVVSDLLRRNK